jgi:hypothetical protein
MEVDAGAGRNRQMFSQVKKGDRILIPHLPQYGQITIAEILKNFFFDRLADFCPILTVKFCNNELRDHRPYCSAIQ